MKRSAKQSSQRESSVYLNGDAKLRGPLSRRTLLRGTGMALALPWLEAMMSESRGDEASVETDAQGQRPSDTPIRMAAMFVPNGVRADQWTPKGEGKDFELSPTLQPLSSYKDKLLVLSNLWNQASNVGDGHYVKCSGYLTCTTINKSLGIDLNCNGRSVDQIAADFGEQHTPLRSLELGIDPVTTGVDTNVGYTRVYGSHIAWNGPTSPLAKELNPQSVFDRLLRATKPSAQSAWRDQLLLDRALGDVKQLNRMLGASDRHRMDEYMQSLRSIEKRIEKQSASQSANWQPLVSVNPEKRPGEASRDNHQEHVRLMMDMIALAFQTDTTRVCTFMFGNAVSGRNFSFLDGVSGGHHDISHHQGNEEKLAQYQLINQWHIEQYGYLLNKLESMQERDGTVLDHSMIMYGSGLRDGNSHSPHNLPIVVAGKAGGRLNSGQHLSFGNDTPLANLYASMLSALGTGIDKFADSTGVLPGVLAS
ncbi:DUF1552 domain-containing protein [Rhodopirellula sp. MGV]|uniref:DUF1552 domain-containing protein n=1 Tax=Rhodopirellula sp. MGV TaxID=2023130 RepID=UPI000B9754A8|nr:DUF1552 domain-containing protein [Rhodopirellula sp. MGV]OYP36802.1 hypothetical protein CGZ80_07080 [Rhodopirellula sp. MGV]PNY36489.1 DUF1552 domain-containing protein [Rhodopirellula baltica]